MTLSHTLSAARDRLVAARIPPDEARLDVDLFARTLLGWDAARLILERTGPVPDGLEPRLSDWVTRRAAREPMAYILGVREFWGLEFRVTPAVLIPRHETELIVEEALRLIRSGALATPPGNEGTAGGLRLADIGTGSGCIAVALAVELPDCSVVASDVSAEAIAVARANAARHGVADRVECVTTHYLDGVPGVFDLIAANPPYVRERDRAALARDVRHEPEVALFGGDSGLHHLAGVLDAVTTRLRPRGWLLMEFGYGQEDDVRALVSERPALQIHGVREDLQGIARTAVVERVA